MSEFEFALSVMSAHDSTAHPEVGHMLAADQLFFKGKLLPLYVHEFNDGSELPTGSCNAHNGVDDVKFPATLFSSEQACLDKLAPTCLANTHNDQNADSFVEKPSNSIIPMSPKSPTCSIKLKCFFALKKLARCCYSCALSGNVNFTSFTPAKFLRRKTQKAGTFNLRSAPLMLHQNVPSSVSRTMQQYGSANTQSLPLEPRLRCCKGGKPVKPLYCSVNDGRNRLQGARHEISIQRMRATAFLYPCSSAADLACKHRCDDVSATTDVNGLEMDKIVDELSASGSDHEDGIKRLSFQVGSYEESQYTYKGYAEEQCRESRSLLYSGNISKGTMRTLNSCVLLNAANGSSKRQGPAAASGTLMNGFKSLNVSKVKSLERSNSYSPKSFERKYHDHFKVMRQREGWRVLERSSSYNGSMHRMRVSPVLNVPIVFMSRSKSVNYATDPCSGHNLFSQKKNLDVNFRMTSAKSPSASKRSAFSKV